MQGQNREETNKNQSLVEYLWVFIRAVKVIIQIK